MLGHILSSSSDFMLKSQRTFVLVLYYVTIFKTDILFFALLTADNIMSSQMSSSQVLRNVYTESLSSLTSVIPLAEHLSKHQYISVDTVDRVTMLEGEGAIGVSQGKELIVDILVTLGPAKVADVKKTLRDFVKSSRKVRPNLDELDVKLPPSLAPVVNGIEKEPEKESEPKIKEKEHKRTKKIPKTEVREKRRYI